VKSPTETLCFIEKAYKEIIIVEKVINFHATYILTWQKSWDPFLTFSRTTSKLGRPSGLFWEAGLVCSSKM